MKMTNAAHERERDEMSAKVDSKTAEHEIAVAQLQLQVTGAEKRTRTLESELEEAAKRLRDARAAKDAADAVAAEAKLLAKEASDRVRAADTKAREAAAADMQRHLSAGEVQEELRMCRVSKHLLFVRTNFRACERWVLYLTLSMRTCGSPAQDGAGCSLAAAEAG